MKSKLLLPIFLFALIIPIVTDAKVNKVKNVQINGIAEASANVSWKQLAKVKFYTVQLKADSGKRIKIWKRVSQHRQKITSSSSLLQAGKTYQVRIRACMTKKNCSKWSMYKKFTTKDYISTDENVEKEKEVNPVDNDNDGYSIDNDCDDDNYAVHDSQTYYADNDEDGLGDPQTYVSVCAITIPSGYVNNALDEDDSDYFNGTPPDCSDNLYNCSDFNTQSEAQQFYQYCFDAVGTDIHDLDRDGNGLACENL